MQRVVGMMDASFLIRKTPVPPEAEAIIAKLIAVILAEADKLEAEK